MIQLMKYILIFLFSLVYTFSFSNETLNINYDEDLGLPINIDLALAGNFCEMRGNHFHTGLDIKTNNKEGYRLYALADGYISRVRISPWGYGKAIYIDYDNGLTSVYAHCNSFPTMIDSLIYTIQKTKEIANIDENVSQLKIRIKKGDIVAFSGNSGSSSAPHLHFEIRETKTEYALNPLNFKVYKDIIKDHKKPEIRGLKFYAISDKGFLIPGQSIYYKVVKDGEKYVINNSKPIKLDTIAINNSQLGIGLYAIDKLDAAYNVCGIYESKLFKNQTLIHHQKIDYMVFDYNRFLNSHQDYFAFRNERKHIHKQFSTSINPLPIYKLNDGKINWSAANATFQIEVFDIHGNKSIVSFKIDGEFNNLKSNILDTKKYIFPDSTNIVNMDGFSAIIEKGSFYEPIEYQIKKIDLDSVSRFLSPTYQVFNYNIPVQKKYPIRIKIPNRFIKLDHSKMAIALINHKNKVYYKGGFSEDGWISSEIRNFGKFTIVIDTISPIIKPLDFSHNKNITKYSTLELSITDNLSGISKYKAYINDNWVLMIYDKKKARYIIPLDKRSKPLLVKGNNEIKIISSDRKNNISSLAVNLIY